jgi:hypothetical protein
LSPLNWWQNIGGKARARTAPGGFVVRMRTLTILSVLQTVGIAALVVHAFGTKEPAAPEERPATSYAPPLSSASSAPSSDAASSVGEERLRAIVREELARLQSSAQGNASSSVEAQPRNPSVDVHQREAVAQQIEAYKGAGTITDAQMQELQTDIAQLDEASRKQMMSKLIRALNSGEIKGRL